MNQVQNERLVIRNLLFPMYNGTLVHDFCIHIFYVKVYKTLTAFIQHLYNYTTTHAKITNQSKKWTQHLHPVRRIWT